MRFISGPSIAVLFSFVFHALPAWADMNTNVQPSPYVVLKEVGNRLFNRISDNQQEINKFPHLMRTIVEEELMPSIDYRYASYLILGKHLKKMSKEQRAEFSKAMRSYLVKTYATALTKYKNQQVIFEQDKPTNSKKIVSIRTHIVELNSPTIDVVFKMRKNNKTQQWKAYDMVIEGISLLTTKQAELGRKITKHGVKQVTLELSSLVK